MHTTRLDSLFIVTTQCMSLSLWTREHEVLVRDRQQTTLIDHRPPLMVAVDALLFVVSRTYALICALLFWCCPSNLRRFTVLLIGLVSKIVIDSIHWMFRWRRWANELQESLETVSVRRCFIPFRTYPYTTTAITRVGDMIGIFCSHMHHTPDTVFPIINGLDALILTTTMRLRIVFPR